MRWVANDHALSSVENFEKNSKSKTTSGFSIAMNTLNPAEKQSARSDADGRVAFRVHSGGMWLIKAVHMIPAAAGSDAQWESLWASLTFQR